MKRRKNKPSAYSSGALLAVLATSQFAAFMPIAASAKGAPETNTAAVKKLSGARIAAAIKANPKRFSDSQNNEQSHFRPNQRVDLVVELKQAPLIHYNFANRKLKSAYSLAKTLAQSRILKNSQNDVQNQIKSKVDTKASFDYSYTNVFNGFSMQTTYKNLSSIKKLSDVKSVFVSAEYDAVPTPPADSAISSDQQMVGLNNASKYNGSGTVVAVIDTGLDTSHPAFQRAPQVQRLTRSSIEGVLPILSAHTRDPQATVGDVYHSGKLPYAFDYGNDDTNVNPANADQAANLEHGTHTSGIAVGDQVDSEGKTVFRGVAPAAQLVSMKVFDDTGSGATDNNILAALDDAYKIGADVVNMSLGSSAGFTTIENQAMNQVYSNLRNSGVDVIVSAGNSTNASQGNPSGTNLPLASQPDDGIVGSPSTFPGATSIASVDNSQVFTNYVLLGQDKLFYSDTSSSFTNLPEKSTEYTVVGGNGTADDFAKVDVAGKIAVISRGGIAFTDKIANAKAAGAIGALIYDNQQEPLISMAVDSPSTSIPAAFISQSDGQKLVAASDKHLTPVTKPDVSPNTATPGQVSDFSSEGVTPDLQLKPEISAPGGSIWSSIPTSLKQNDPYQSMSGTSMAAPSVAGLAALLKQYLNETQANLSNADKEKVANDLLISTAHPVTNAQGVITTSPRRQGAGLVNVSDATTSPVYAYTDTDSGKPVLNLGDDPQKTGVYTMRFHLKNMSNHAQSYTVDGKALVPNTTMINGQRYMTATDHQASGTWGGDMSIHLAPNEDKTVSLTFSLAANERDIINGSFPNGTYVEGFAGLKSQTADTPDLSLPFLAFYGDWEKAPTIDSATWMAGTPAHTITEAGWSLMGFFNFDLGGDIFAPTAHYNEVQNTISPNGDGLDDSIDYLSVGALRASSHNSYSVTNAKGQQVFSDSENNVAKSYYYPSQQSWISFSNPAIFTGLDSENQSLPEGQYTYHVTTTPVAPIGDVGRPHIANDRSTVDFKFNIDTTAPTVNEKNIRLEKDGDKRYLIIPASDNFNLMDAMVYPVVNGQPDADADPITTSPLSGSNRRHDFRLDVSSAKDDHVFVGVLDNGYNETDLNIDLSKLAAQKSAGISVQSVDEKGKKIAKDQTLNGNVGDEYTLEPADIKGYKFNHAVGSPLKGTLPEAAGSIKLIYDRVVPVKSASRVQITSQAGAQLFSDFGATAPKNNQILKEGTLVRVQAAYQVDKTVWYQIGKQQFIRASDTNQGVFSVAAYPKNIRVKRTAKLYLGFGLNAKPNGRVFFRNSSHKVYEAYRVDGVVWYRVGNNIWMHADDAY